MIEFQFECIRTCLYDVKERSETSSKKDVVLLLPFFLSSFFLPRFHFPVFPLFFYSLSYLFILINISFLFLFLSPFFTHLFSLSSHSSLLSPSFAWLTPFPLPVSFLPFSLLSPSPSPPPSFPSLPSSFLSSFSLLPSSSLSTNCAILSSLFAIH